MEVRHVRLVVQGKVPDRGKGFVRPHGRQGQGRLFNDRERLDFRIVPTVRENRMPSGREQLFFGFNRQVFPPRAFYSGSAT